MCLDTRRIYTLPKCRSKYDKRVVEWGDGWSWKIGVRKNMQHTVETEFETSRTLEFIVWMHTQWDWVMEIAKEKWENDKNHQKKVKVHEKHECTMSSDPKRRWQCFNWAAGGEIEITFCVWAQKQIDNYVWWIVATNKRKMQDSTILWHSTKRVSLSYFQSFMICFVQVYFPYLKRIAFQQSLFFFIVHPGNSFSLVYHKFAILCVHLMLCHHFFFK